MMKTFRLFAAMTAMAALLALSCAKTEAPETAESAAGQPDAPQVEPDVPEVVPEGYVRVSLSAGAEQCKTTIADGEGSARIVSWEAGDEIKVLYAGGSRTAHAQQAGTQTSLIFDVPEAVETVYLGYPAAAGLSLSGSALSVTIPAEQAGAFADANFAIASAATTDNAVQFYNASSMFKLVVTDATLTRAVITGNNGEALAGTLPFTFSGSGITPGTAASTSTSLSVSLSGAKTYYVAALPGLNLTNGATVQFYRGETPAGAFKLGTALSVARAQIASWGEVDKVACNRYVTVNGAGSKNGRSWENAWGKAELKAFLTNSASYTADELALMNGITVRIAAGTYVLPDSASDKAVMNYSDVTETALRFAFVGGYPAAGGASANPSTNVTALSGGDLSTILRVNGTTHLSFEGLTFCHGSSSVGGYGALTVANTGSLVLTDCIFSDNVNTATCGALDVTDGCQFAINGCTFRDNAATHAGAFNMDSNENITSGTITNCLFSDNALNNNGNGGALKVTSGNVTVTDCQFLNNTTLFEGESGTHGGAVWLDGGQATFNSCTFKGNSSRWGGAVYSKNYGNGTFNDCIFGGSGEGNAALAGGGAVAMDGGRLAFNRCSASGNSSGDRGGVFFVSASGGVLDLDGGVWSGNTAPYGGVAHVQSTSVFNASDATFSGNEAGNFGGVFSINATGTVNLTSSVVSDNTAGAAGGAFFLYGNGTKSVVTPKLNILGGCTVSGNHATSGGALRARQEPVVATTDEEQGNETKADITITGDNTFSGNYATGGYGGCLDIRTSGKVIISGATFTDNYTDKLASYCKGGAINVSDGGMQTGDFTLSQCVFRGNHTKNQNTNSNSSDDGGAVNIGGNGTNWKLSVKMDKCAFYDNWANKGGALNILAASTVAYLNDCVFSGNYIGYRYGATIQATNASLLMNNCSFADNTYSTTGSNQQCAWVNVKPAKLVMSNCTLIGTTRKNGNVSAGDKACLLRFDGIANTHYLINNIIASNQSACFGIWADNSPVINATSNKVSTKSLGSSVTYNTAGTESDGFTGNSSCFGSLAWTGGSSWNDSYWAWNGTLSGGDNTGKASLADVKSAIQSADSGFYTWLDGLGALDKDGRNQARATTTWPGAYQN
ncbi:MAG: hypothetical protein IJR34_00035 [Bacteroidales bacterium]|nr:hypothetical protein [Bacteroidales bacterium]